MEENDSSHIENIISVHPFENSLSNNKDNFKRKITFNKDLDETSFANEK